MTDSKAEGGETKTSSTISSSFFNFENRHTSHLSSPSAQSVQWSVERHGITNVLEGYSKPVQKYDPSIPAPAVLLSSGPAVKMRPPKSDTSTGTMYVPSKAAPPSATSSTISSNTSTSTDSFFDFTDRHTSHLTSASAQNVEWSERKGLFVDLAEGYSKPASSVPVSEAKPRQMVTSSYNQSNKSTNKSTAGGGETKTSSSLINQQQERFKVIASKPKDQRTSEDMEFIVSFQESLGVETSISRKNGSIPGRQRPDAVSSPVSTSSTSIITATNSINTTTSSTKGEVLMAAVAAASPRVDPAYAKFLASSSSSRSSTQPSTSSQPGAAAAAAASSVTSSAAIAYDIVFIMNQLAAGKISQDQFDTLNAKLM